ncbi:MAG: Asp-tRNA(Asn)/Glu-tRNA(Gln) amidotransferase GatCAB subunit A [Alphaproteobacteria bacterium CG_4_10_14_0_8_um_filter_53_9]|nr:MAG: Asp-tRNA(Asn)/Glu-tRNA(Gln) amidotransferase GatCAB subunit A [Alphaproteobacteria bacterium CG_4_10_14_0_8_um_filter_53_9]
MSEMLKWTATEALAKMATGEVTSVQLTEAVLARAEARADATNAYITICREDALAAAAASDARRAKGEVGLLEGLPMGLKDLFCTKGILTTAASHILDGFTPAYESTVSAKLAAAGAVCVGKLNLDEFAMGGSGEHSFYGPAKNPWDTSRVPGGSSSGSAAAVADYQCYVATGTDTGGSIRQPASFTGIVGIKPTYGRCSRFGVVAFASSLDQPGAMARDVSDAALFLQAMAGHDVRDSTSAPLDVPNWVEETPKGSLKGLRVGLPKEYFIEGLDPVIAQAVKAAADKMAAAGAEITEVSLPHTKYAVAAYYIAAPAEAASNLARYDGMRYGLRVEGANLTETYTNTRTAGFGDEVKRRIMVGNYVLSSGYYDAYYTQAQKVRSLIAQDFENVFTNVDVILAPTAPSLAFKIGEKSNDPVALYLEDAFTIPASMAGLPALSIPCGTAEKDGVTLPIGMQLIGAPWAETKILQTAYAWEQLRGTFTTPFNT